MTRMNIKLLLAASAIVLLAASCDFGAKPAELYIPKNTVEFAGNAFSSFSLGSDVKLYTAQNPDDKSQWVVQAVVPVRKETKGQISGLSIDLVPQDDHGIRVRDGFVLHGEDLDNLVPVYNSADGVERTIVFSVSEGGVKKYFTRSEAKDLVDRTKGVRMDFNLVSGAASTAAPEASASTEYPMTLDGLCRKYGVYGLLGQYDYALAHGQKSRAKQIEDKLWSIEKKVQNDYTVPEWLRDKFEDWIEDREDQIEDKY